VDWFYRWWPIRAETADNAVEGSKCRGGLLALMADSAVLYVVLQEIIQGNLSLLSATVGRIAVESIL
jgi:hypothetical protein